ncbi:hypothetical protein CYLTODRAFT_401382 [Cylindrobasidium torrendii FP15055 ss-10]|uniref:LCCL domain-containing protein n=1 Tax=Cylindrobasidium torrendii FP15055 ss-10 TaxID=1314674 RepID=A0A0D7B2I9_9AGAR|nr:hypothetical protein CYLTODRAFT_401382 [Cylindrobasidium torrendii FP15055 ss-10]
MSVSADFNTLNISGVFVMNKGLSGNTDEVLRLQGVGWMKRKAISMATITLTIKHYKDENEEEHIDIDQVLTGGVPGTTENRHLTWTPRENNDSLFGHVIGKSRRVKADVLEDELEHLKVGWTEDTYEHGLIQAYAESDTPKSGTTWVGNQTWGVEIINGERRYARHLKFLGPGGEDIQIKMVYDFIRPL